MSFTKLTFLEAVFVREDKYIECFLISSETVAIKINYHPICNEYHYYDHMDRNDKITIELLAKMRTELIADIKQQRTMYITKLQLINDRLHPDVIPLVAILLNNLLPEHYLETV